MRYLRGQDEAGHSYPIADPLAEQLQAAARIADLDARVDALLAIDAVFGDDLAGRIEFSAVVRGHLRRIDEEGVLVALGKIR